MRYSIRRKLVSVLLVFMLMIIASSYVINVFFIKEYYIEHKQNAFKDIYNEINEASKKNESVSTEQFQSVLVEICEKEGITLLIVDYKGNSVFNYGNDSVSYERLFDAMLGIDLSEYRTEVISNNDNNNYTLQVVHSEESEKTYFEMWGALENGNSFIVRMAYQGMEENMNVTNRVYIVVSIFLIMMVTFAMYGISMYFTRPIRKLSDISKKMMDLDFDAKYTEQRSDEIDVLGKNMNELSAKLKATISELKSANIELQKDIAEKTQVDEQRKEFLSNVSHELKTPIALIQGYAEGLKEGINDDQESREFYCDVIIDESKKMNNIVKKLLTLNQLEFGKNHFSMECFDITQVINGILNSVNILLKQKNVTVYFDNTKPVFVWADEFQTEEILNNYISNAINHVANEKIIKITIESQEENTVRINVFNSGKHIPEDSIDSIWDKFYKVDKARTREYGGSGLGLSIVKAIMESVNQHYGVKNVEGGVLFWFEVEKKTNCGNIQMPD